MAAPLNGEEYPFGPHVRVVSKKDGHVVRVRDPAQTGGWRDIAHYGVDDVARAFVRAIEARRSLLEGERV